MPSSSWDRTRLIRAAASFPTVLAVIAGVVILALGLGLPDSGWPPTGQAFTTGTHALDHEPCDLIAGPAKNHCAQASTTSTSANQPSSAGAAWRLLPAGAAVTGLVVWRYRGATGRRRA
ncbi:hypothetical protein BN159_0419 [Streptomyces davaonensis JCM 4913]|uniref:Uncharacterized protein n=1 Tax=Streptomyces davaonensis (strain DSM 101723 / JCM 4913 / KCC S-0913 / 768) TaxID=1214101 RepID=K4QUZ0_STRDJ|nr:hypothetical protein BN159_0419 [Streptomyces davaonensis JCM 4913]